MKKNLQLFKSPKVIVCITACVMSVAFFACKKMTGSFVKKQSATIAIDERAKVHLSEITQWISSLPAPLPFPLQWDKAQQNIVNGKHVIRLPISDHSCIIFTKDGPNEPIKSYAYKWENDKPKDKEFFGQIAWFSFQDYQMRGQNFLGSKASRIITIKTKFDLSAIKQNIQNSASVKNTGQIKPQSILGDIFHTIGNLFGAMGCVMVGGSWDQGGDWANNQYGSWSQSCSGEFWTWDWASADTGGNDSESTGDTYPTFNLTMIDTITGMEVSYDNTSGDVGGGWGGYNPAGDLVGDAGLNTGDYSFLVGHQSMATELDNYLWNPSMDLTRDQRNAVVQKHLLLMETDADYLTFVNNFESSNYTGLAVWWTDNCYIDGEWLDNAINLTTAESKGYFASLGLESDLNLNLNGETNDETIGGYDLTNYADYQPNTSWPTISPVISVANFVPYRDKINCLVLAKEQLSKAGYQISGYGATGQTYTINTTGGGIDAAMAKKAAGYMIGALQAGIPVVVGIDYMLGSPVKTDGTPANPDLTTDHFIVVVGTGTDGNGKFFNFYDSATSSVKVGTSEKNKLYYNETTGVISGTTEVAFAVARQRGVPQYRNSNGNVIYIVTHVRRTKTK